MALVHKLKDYQFAKTVVLDLEKVLVILDRAISDLDKYSKYRYITIALSNLKEYRTVLKAQLDNQQTVIESKGLKIDELS